jgi:formate dehydrogenase subunit gamma
MTNNDPNLIERYTANERTNHWIIAICFALLSLSGLALFHPSLYWLTAVLGGGQWTRILHPFIGVVMFVAFFIFALGFWRENYLDKDDVAWLRQFNDVLAKREDRLPEVGRYNAGHKMLFFLMVLCMALLFISGIVIWRRYFSDNFSIGTIRLASVVHAAAAFVLIIGVIVHVYAAFWVKGATRAMIRGTVTLGWARKHHPKWFRESIK